MTTNVMASVELEDFQVMSSNHRNLKSSHQFSAFAKKGSSGVDATTINMRIGLGIAATESKDSTIEEDILSDQHRTEYGSRTKHSKFGHAELPDDDSADGPFLHGARHDPLFGSPSDTEQKEPLDFSRKYEKSKAPPATDSTRTKLRNKIELQLSEIRNFDLMKTKSQEALLMTMGHDSVGAGSRKMTNGHRGHQRIPELLRFKASPGNGIMTELGSTYVHDHHSSQYESMTAGQFKYDDMESLLNGHHPNGFGLSPAMSETFPDPYAFPANYFSLNRLQPYLSKASDLLAKTNDFVMHSANDPNYVEFKRQIRQFQQQGGHGFGAPKRGGDCGSRLQKLNSLLATTLQSEVKYDTHAENGNWKQNVVPQFHSAQQLSRAFVQQHYSGVAPKSNGDSLTKEALTKNGDANHHPSESPTPSSSRSSTPPHPQRVFDSSRNIHGDSLHVSTVDRGDCASPSNSMISNEDSVNNTQNSCNSDNSQPNTENSRNNHATNGHSMRGSKKRGRSLPDALKDEAYWERRRKNNEAAKRSRDARRAKEDEIAIRAAFLEQENLKLKVEVTALKNETAKLRCLLYNNN